MREKLNVKTLGEAEDEEIDDTAAWIERSRRIEAQRRAAEIEKAAKLAMKFDEQVCGFLSSYCFIQNHQNIIFWLCECSVKLIS